MIPRATLRLQFHKGFSFVDAEAHVAYFARLGISHIYASPITTARPGSLHGYDVIDPMHVNPELGGEDGLQCFVRALRKAGLGLIIDIVPNHMAVGAENAWWFDVLRRGQASPYASWFDIDWNPSEETLRGKVLLPFLCKPLAEILRKGEIVLSNEGDGPIARYFGNRFPIAGNAGGDIATTLDRQHYRLASWRTANDQINWRRFFDINELVGVRMENADAFEAVHKLIFRLYGEGVVDGVRVDHVDGLADPGSYCRRLRARLEALTASRPPNVSHGKPYIVVEKILLGREQLPESWQTNGTSGYDFMNQVSALQHDAGGEGTLTRLWARYSGREADFQIEEETARREIVSRNFSAQLESCAASFDQLARENGEEVPRAALRRALIELLAHFPVYRTYAASGTTADRGENFLKIATAGAKLTCLSTDRYVIDHLQEWMAHPRDSKSWRRAVTYFEQLSAPVAAKAVEDTAFYRYGRLLSRNDVGFDAKRFSDGSEDFHAHILQRQRAFPHAMLATATHDHKRGEDTRARLAVLSEYATEWAEAVPRWLSQYDCVGPSPRDLMMLFQTIVGAWPLDLDIGDERRRRGFAERLAQWQQKALREAKLETDWSVPNSAYETAAGEVLDALVARNARPELLKQIVTFAERIAPGGAVNGLVQTLLKLTVPGVPDLYQGTELWDLSLVDPDNRRAVSYVKRTSPRMTAGVKELAQNWRDGRVKQALVVRLLEMRRRNADLFEKGSYEPLAVHGDQESRVVAFQRRFADSMVVVVALRTVAKLLHPGSIGLDASKFVHTKITLDHEVLLADLFDSRAVHLADRVEVASLLNHMPFAILVSSDLL